MSILPVIVRELRIQARHPLTYWLRVMGVLSVAVAFAMAVFQVSNLGDRYSGAGAQNTMATFGTALFGKLNLCIFLTIWVLVPLSTADAICRERREGTLAFLYLTKLRSWEIVIGKASAHILRSLTIFLAMIPWLLVPFLFGGVELRDLKMALLLNTAALLLALGAGLLASAYPRDWLKAVILAELLAMLLLVSMVTAHENVLYQSVQVGTRTPANPGQVWSGRTPLYHRGGYLQRTLKRIQLATNSSFGVSYQWVGGLRPVPMLETHWKMLWTNLTPTGHQTWFRGAIEMVAISALVLLLALMAAASCVQRSWQDAPASARFLKLKSTWMTPRIRVHALRQNLSRSMSANPIGWLQQYSPAARLVKWGWCFFILIVQILLSTNVDDLYGAQTGVGLILLLGLGFSATGSFRNELESGAFEMLLVTPLRERQIIIGRVRGLWGQFLPSMIIYGTGSIYLVSGWNIGELAYTAWVTLAWMMGAFFAFPFVGLFFSVQRLNFFVSWIFTCLVCLVPSAVGLAFKFPLAQIFLIQLGVGLSAAFLVERHLRTRRFLRSSR